MFHCSARLCDAGGVINAIISSHAQVLILCIIPLNVNLLMQVEILHGWACTYCRFWHPRKKKMERENEILKDESEWKHNETNER